MNRKASTGLTEPVWLIDEDRIMSEAGKFWYYNKAGDTEKFGPYTDDELIRLIRQGILTENDYIWMMDLEDWLRLGNSIYSSYIIAE